MYTPSMTSNRVARRDMADDPRFAVGWYIDDVCNRLVPLRFPGTHLFQDKQKVRDARHGSDCDTTGGA